MPAGSLAPLATVVQVPSEPESPHDMQLPLQALSQQTPWAQKPDLHWLPTEQAPPLLASPQELMAQRFGVRHWVSALQAMKHRVPLQVYGAQGSDGGFTQRPAPSQVENGV